MSYPQASFACVITACWPTAAKPPPCPYAGRPWDKGSHRHRLSRTAWRSGCSSGPASTSRGVPPVVTSLLSSSPYQWRWGRTATETHRHRARKEPLSASASTSVTEQAAVGRSPPAAIGDVRADALPVGVNGAESQASSQASASAVPHAVSAQRQSHRFRLSSGPHAMMQYP
jgi:hypothetical protein